MDQENDEFKLLRWVLKKMQAETTKYVACFQSFFMFEMLFQSEIPANLIGP